VWVFGHAAITATVVTVLDKRRKTLALVDAMNAKPFFQSKTIIGAVMMAISLGLQFYQVDAPAEDLAKAGADLTLAVQGITGFVGFVLVIIGRIKAKQPLKISGIS